MNIETNSFLLECAEIILGYELELLIFSDTILLTS